MQIYIGTVVVRFAATTTVVSCPSIRLVVLFPIKNDAVYVPLGRDSAVSVT